MCHRTFYVDNVTVSVTLGDSLDDYLSLEFDEGSRVHVFNRDHKLMLVVSDPQSLTRYDGWVFITSETKEHYCTTYFPADRFNHVQVLRPISYQGNEDEV